MTVLVNAIFSAANLVVNSTRSSNNQYESVDKFETPVFSTYAVSGNVFSGNVIFSRANTVTLNKTANLQGGSILFNGTSDYLTVNSSFNYQTMANIAPPFIANAIQYASSYNSQSFIFAPGYNVGNSYAYYFNGVNDILAWNDRTGNEFGTGLNQFCIEFYINKQANTNGTIFILNQNSTNNSYGTVRLDAAAAANGSSLTLLMSNTGTSWTINQTVGYIPHGVWNHVVLSRTSTNGICTWINGYPTYYSNTLNFGNLTYTTNFPSNNQLVIGVLMNGSSLTQPLNAYLSNFRFSTSTQANNTNGQYVIYAPNTVFTPPQLPLSDYVSPNTQILFLGLQYPSLQDTSFGTGADPSSLNPNNPINYNTTATYGNPGNLPVPVSNVTLYTSTNIQQNTALSSTGSFSTYAVYMTGNSSFSIANTSAFNFGSNNFCIEFWTYPTAAPSTNWTSFLELNSNSINQSVGNYVRIGQNINNGGYGLGIVNGLGAVGNDTNIGYGTLPINTWSHLALVKNDRAFRLYRNGSLISTTTANATNYSIPFWYTNNALTIGIDAYPGDGNTASNSAFKGYISNLRITNGNTVYNSNFIPPNSTFSNTTSTNLSLLTFNSSSLTDQSPFNLTISNTGYANLVPVTISYSTFDFNNHDFTMECWAYINEQNQSAATLNQYYTLFELNDNTTSNRVYLEQYVNSLHFAINGTLYINAPPLIPRQWHHCVVQRYLGVTFLYVDGILQGTTTTNYSGPSSNTYYSFQSGASVPYWTSNIDKMDGYVSNVRITKGAVYKSFTPPTTALTGNSSTLMLTAQSNTLIDNSPNNPNNTPWVPTGPIITNTDTPFPNTYSIYFNGTSQANVTYNANLNLSSGDFTVEAYVFSEAIGPSNSNTNIQSILDKDGVSGSTYPSYNLYLSPSAFTSGSGWWYPAFRVGSGNGVTSIQQIYSNVAINFGTWNHIAATKQGTTLNLWVNGVLANTQALSATITDGGKALVIGNEQGQSCTYFEGYISNIRITKGNALYTTNFTPSNTALTASTNTTLLTAQSPILIDNSSTNNIIVSSTIQFSNTVVPFTPAASWRFTNTVSTTLSQRDMLPMHFGTNNFTVEAFVNLTGLPTQDTWPAQASNTFVLVGTGTPSLADGIDCLIGSQHLSIQVNDVQYLSTNVHGISANTWYHLAYVRNNGVVTFYVNGTSIGSNTFANSTGLGSNTYIGSETNQVSYFNGYISNLRVINGSALYTTNFTPPTANLTYISNSTATTTILTCQTMGNLNDAATANSTLLRSYGFTSSPWLGVKTNTNIIPFANTFSFEFDGQSQILQSLGSLAFPNFSSGFTVEMFAYFNNNVFPYQLVSSSLGSPFYLTATNTTNFSVSGTNFTSPVTLAGNTWYHIAVNRNPTTNATTVFVNGTKSTTGNVAITTSFGSINYIAGNTTTSAFKGYLSNIRVSGFSNAYDSTASTITVPTAPLLPTSNTTILLTANIASIKTPFNDPIGSTVWSGGSVGFSNTVVPFSGTYSYYFNGTQGIAGQPTIAPGQWKLLSSLPILQQFCIEAWIYPLSFSSNWGNSTTQSGLIGYGTINNTYLQWSFGPNLNGQLVFYIWTGSAISVIHPTTIPVGKWTHIAAVKNGYNLTLYVDGIPYSATINTTDYEAGPQCYINIGEWNNSFIHGYVSNLRVSNTLVYPSASNTTPIASIPVPTSPLLPVSNSTAQTYLITSQNNILTDSSGYFGANVGYSLSTFGYGNNFQVTSFQYGSFSNAVIDAWIYPTSNTGNSVIIDQLSSNTGGLGNWNLYMNNGTLTYSYDGNNIITGPSITPNTWTYVTIVKDSANVYLYTNSSLSNTIAYSNVFGNSSTLIYVGASQLGGVNNFFNGYVSNLRIANSNIIQTRVTSNSYYFDGSNTFLSTPANSAFSFGTGDFTLETWVYPVGFGPTNVTSNSSYSYYWIWGYKSGSATSPWLAWSNTGLVYATDSGNVISTSTQLPLRTWSHVAVSRVSGNSNMYLNGTIIGSNTSDTNNYTDANSKPIGATGGTGNTFNWQGYMSNFRIVKGTGVYTTNFTTPSAPLTAISNTVLLTAQNTAIIDNSSNNFTITNNLSVYGVGSWGNVISTNNSPTFSNTVTTIFTPGTVPSNPTDPNNINNLLLIGQGTSTGQSFRFDKLNNNYMATTYGNLGGAPFGFGYLDFTVEGWVNLTSLPAGDTIGSGFYIVGTTSGGSYTDGMAFFIGRTKMFMQFAGVQYISNANHNMSINNWYHVAWVRKSGLLTFFVNGVIAGSVIAAPSPSIGTLFSIGNSDGYQTNNTQQFDGYLSNLRITKFVALYTSNFTPPTEPFNITNGINFGTTSYLSLSDAGLYFDVISGYSNGYSTPVGNPTFFVNKNPFAAEAVIDSSQYNNLITQSNRYSPTMVMNSPFGNSNTLTVTGSKQPVITTNSSIISYINVPLINKSAMANLSTIQIYAANAKYVYANTQQIYITSTVTPVTVSGGGTISEIWI